MLEKIKSFFRMIWVRFSKKNVSIRISAFMCSKSTISENCTLHKRVRLWCSSMGVNSYIGPDSIVCNTSIGKYCSIGPDVRIGGLGKHPSDWISTSPIFYSPAGPMQLSFSNKRYFDEHENIQIGNDVWIGSRAILLDGVKIGNGAIIGAGAVVTKDVEPYAIVGGAPARVIRKRFADSEILKIEGLEWWDWDINKIQDNLAIFRMKVEGNDMNLDSHK